MAVKFTQITVRLLIGRVFDIIIDQNSNISN